MDVHRVCGMVIATAIFARCGAELSLTDETLLMGWADVKSKVLDNVWMSIALVDYQSTPTNFPQYGKSRGVLESMRSGQISDRWVTWNKNKCFQSTVLFDRKPGSFALLHYTIEGVFGASLTNEISFIGTPDSENYMLVIVCLGGWKDGICPDATVFISVKESVYDVNQDGVIDNEADPSLEEIRRFAESIFKNPIVDVWTENDTYCPLPETDRGHG